MDSQGSDEANEEGPQGRTLQAPHATDGDHGKGLHPHFHGESRGYGNGRGDCGASESSAQGPQGKRQSINTIHVDTDRDADLPIVNHRHDNFAEAGAPHQPHQGATEHEGDANEQEMVPGIRDASEGDVPEQRCRRTHHQRGSAPDEFNEIVEDEEDGEGEQQLDGFGLPVNAPQKQALNERPSDHPDNQGPGQEHQVSQIRAQPSVEDLQGQIRAEICPKRIKTTMGDIQNAQHTEDERETYRQQKQHCGKHEAIQYNDSEQSHARPFSASPPSPTSQRRSFERLQPI